MFWMILKLYCCWNVLRDVFQRFALYKQFLKLDTCVIGKLTSNFHKSTIFYKLRKFYHISRTFAKFGKISKTFYEQGLHFGLQVYPGDRQACFSYICTCENYFPNSPSEITKFVKKYFAKSAIYSKFFRIDKFDKWVAMGNMTLS